jgi:metal-dependent amidase/aminoacylase/carboxypeptidase family protein
MASLYADALDLSDRLTALRRAIHGEPELGLHTPRTMAKVRAALAHLPLEWRTGPSTTGAVAVLRGAGTRGALSFCAAIWTPCPWARKRAALRLHHSRHDACLRA